MNCKATLLAILIGVLTIVESACDADRERRVPRIGVLAPQKSTEPASLQLKPFERGLRELGWVPGKTVIVEYGYAEGDMRRLAQSLSRDQCDHFGGVRLQNVRIRTHDYRINTLLRNGVKRLLDIIDTAGLEPLYFDAEGLGGGF